MKQKDITLILVIVIISAVASFFVARAVFAAPKDRQVKAEVVSPLSVGFNSPSKKYFNENAVNPTQQIRIGDSANVTPFSGQ